jgi:ABC-type antimicrobial peptide transport system permease subunit
MWNDTQIEQLFFKKIKNETETTYSSEIYKNNYIQVRNNFCQNVYNNIGRVEPNLTDHGEKHIKNVLQNAYFLINNNDNLSGIELYVLCMAILVHDIGNLNGRKGHEQTLNKYFSNKIFNTIDQNHIRTISLIASKHGGKECDTIGSLEERDYFDAIPIRSRKIAAILRFADELAEGKQRTSLSYQDYVSDASKIFHEYATILEPPAIQKDTVVLNFNIYLDKIETNIEDMLNFIATRIEKLNNERVYCAHYCNHIHSIKKIAISLKFYSTINDFNEIKIDNDFSDLINFELSNKNIHCDESQSIHKRIEKILEKLKVNDE